MGLVLVVLVVLLGLASYLLYRVVSVPTVKARVAATSAPSAPGLEWVRSIYGTSNLSKDEFSQPQAAVPCADGSIWVTDPGKSVLMHFSPDGRYIGALNSTEPSVPLSRPSRMAVGPDGTLYVCETAMGLVRALHPDGSDAGSFYIPEPISVAASADRLAVGSVSGFAILEKTGKPIKVIGTRGKGDGQFDYVHGIAIGANGNVYVTDSYNNRLSAYDRDGKRLWIEGTGAPANSAQIINNMLATKDTSSTVLKGADALQLPLGLTLDGAGRVVVIDLYDCSLSVFDPTNGKFIAKYGDAGQDDGQFFYPVSVGYDPGRDWFTVADAMNRRIQIVRIPGSSGGGVAAVATVNRTMTGPLRACLLPLLLLLFAVVAWFVVRMVRRRRGSDETEPAAGAIARPVSVAVEAAGGDDALFDDN
jgi:DNA-binding beta-propeller fold protein YncE